LLHHHLDDEYKRADKVGNRQGKAVHTALLGKDDCRVDENDAQDDVLIEKDFSYQLFHHWFA